MYIHIKHTIFITPLNISLLLPRGISITGLFRNMQAIASLVSEKLADQKKKALKGHGVSDEFTLKACIIIEPALLFWKLYGRKIAAHSEQALHLGSVLVWQYHGGADIPAAFILECLNMG